MQLLVVMGKVAVASLDETRTKAQILDVVSATVAPSNVGSIVNAPGVTESLILDAMDVMAKVMDGAEEDMPDLVGSFGAALSDVAVALENDARQHRHPSVRAAGASSVTRQFGTLATGVCDALLSDSLDGEAATGSTTNQFSLSCKKDVVGSAGTILIKPLSLQHRMGGAGNGPAQPIRVEMGAQADYSATFMQGPPGAFTRGAAVLSRRRRLTEAVRTKHTVTAAELRMKLSSLPHKNQKMRVSTRVELSPRYMCGNHDSCTIRDLHSDVHLRDSQRHGVLTHISFVDNGDGGLVQKFYTAEMLASEALYAPKSAARAGQAAPRRQGAVVVTILERNAEPYDTVFHINEVHLM